MLRRLADRCHQDLSFFRIPELPGILRQGAGREGLVWNRAGRSVLCKVTVTRPKKPLMAPASDPEAVALGRIPALAGDGPCMAAVRELRTIHVQNLGSDKQWPALALAAADLGYRSILAVPVGLDDQTRAALLHHST